MARVVTPLVAGLVVGVVLVRLARAAPASSEVGAVAEGRAQTRAATEPAPVPVSSDAPRPVEHEAGAPRTDVEGPPTAPTAPGLDAPSLGSAAVSAGPPPLLDGESWTVPAPVLEAVRKSSGRPIGERLEIATHPLLGRRYVNESNGEGEGIDPDPPARYDAFDCLTFVEEALALALAGDPLHAPAIRSALRWEGRRSYENRRHFMEASWVPAAVSSGLLDDITGRVGRPRTLRKDVTADTWRRWGRRSLFKLPDERLPVGEYALQYLDLEEAVASAARIPPGSVLLTLREPRTWVPVVTTHISLVVSDGTRTRMRHATRMGSQEVRDDRVDWYLRHLSTYVNWRVLGVAVYYPREQGPRVSALTPSAVSSVRFPPLEGPPPASPESETAAATVGGSGPPLGGTALGADRDTTSDPVEVPG